MTHPQRNEFMLGLRKRLTAGLLTLVLLQILPLLLGTYPTAAFAEDAITTVEADNSPSPAEKPAPSNRREVLLASLTIFVLAIFIGFEMITKVPPTLHTPLMSGSNAISGITVVGALLVSGGGLNLSTELGFFAVLMATINAVGGFLVTHRMLAMFKKRK